MADEHKMRFFKTSAFSGENVKEMINFTIEEVYKHKVIPILDEEEKSGKKASENIKLTAADKPKEQTEQKSRCC